MQEKTKTSLLIIITIISKAQILKKPSALSKEHDGRWGSWSMYIQYKNQRNRKNCNCTLNHTHSLSLTHTHTHVYKHTHTLLTHFFGINFTMSCKSDFSKTSRTDWDVYTSGQRHSGIHGVKGNHEKKLLAVYAYYPPRQKTLTLPENGNSQQMEFNPSKCNIICTMPNEQRKVLTMTSSCFIYPDIQLFYLCANTVHIKSQQVSENHHQQWLLLVHPRWGCNSKRKPDGGVPVKELQDHTPKVKLATNTTTVEPHIRVCLSCLGSPQAQGHPPTVKQNWTPSCQVCDHQLHRRIIRHCWCHSHAWKSAVDKVLNNEDEKSCLGMLAMSTFSPVSPGSSNGMRICVWVDVMNLKYAARWHIQIYIYFIPYYDSAIHKHTHTRILKLFEDREPTGVKSGCCRDALQNRQRPCRHKPSKLPPSLWPQDQRSTKTAPGTDQTAHSLPLLLPPYSLWMEPPPHG